MGVNSYTVIRCICRSGHNLPLTYSWIPPKPLWRRYTLVREVVSHFSYVIPMSAALVYRSVYIAHISWDHIQNLLSSFWILYISECIEVLPLLRRYRRHSCPTQLIGFL